MSSQSSGAVEQVGLINGEVPDSTEEWRVYLSLIKYGIEFEYQYPVYGGSLVQGGMLIDFYLKFPFDNALEIFGTHWHNKRTERKDELKIARLTEIFRRIPYIVYDYEIPTQKDTDSRIAELLL